MTNPRSHRPRLAGVVLATIAFGASTRLFPIGNTIWDKSAGDAAYATMIYFMVAFVQPRARRRSTFGITVALCIAIECFQLTGIPSRLPHLLRIALGTRFGWHDIACYVVGASAATLLHALMFRERSSPR